MVSKDFVIHIDNPLLGDKIRPERTGEEMCHIEGRYIGVALKKLLKERKITQAELSRAINMKESYMSAIANGKIKNPRLQTFNRIARALGMTVTQIINEIERVSKGDGR